MKQSKANMGLIHICGECGKTINCNSNLFYIKYLTNDWFYARIYLHHINHKDFEKYKKLKVHIFKLIYKALILVPMYYILTPFVWIISVYDKIKKEIGVM